MNAFWSAALLGSLVMIGCAEHVSTDERKREGLTSNAQSQLCSLQEPVVAESPFLKAAVEGDNKQLRELVAAGQDPNQTFGDKLRTALACAVDNDKNDAIQTLLRLGADANIANAAESTPLHLAVSRKNAFAIDKLMLRGANAKLKRSDGSTPLNDAVALGDVAIVDALFLHAGLGLIDVNQPGGPDHLGPLARATQDDNLPMVQSLIGYRAVAGYVSPSLVKSDAVREALKTGIGGLELSLILTMNDSAGAPYARRFFPLVAYTPSGETALQLDLEGGDTSAALAGFDPSNPMNFDSRYLDLVKKRLGDGGAETTKVAADTLLGKIQAASLPDSGIGPLDFSSAELLRNQVLGLLAVSESGAPPKTIAERSSTRMRTNLKPVFDALYSRNIENFADELFKVLSAAKAESPAYRTELQKAVDEFFTDNTGALTVLPFAQPIVTLSSDWFSDAGLKLRKNLNTALVAQQIIEAVYALHCRNVPDQCTTPAEQMALENARQWLNDVYALHAVVDQAMVPAPAILATNVGNLLQSARAIFETTNLLADLEKVPPMIADVTVFEMQKALEKIKVVTDKIDERVKRDMAKLKEAPEISDPIVAEIVKDAYSQVLPKAKNRNPGPAFTEAVEEIIKAK